MNKTHLRRSIAALGTAVACLVVMANPAAAVTHDATITGGEITLTKTGITPEVIDLAPGSPTCPTTTFPPGLTTDITTTTLAVTGLASRAIRTFGTTGTFLTVLTRHTSFNVVGARSGTNVITGLRVAVAAAIYPGTAYNATTCVVTGAATCNLLLLLNLTGTITGDTSGSTGSFTGSSQGTVVNNPNCATGPAYLTGSTGTVTVPIAALLTT